MTYNLNDRKVAILATNGFEQSELVEPLNALKKAGATAEVIAPDGNRIRGWNGGDWGDYVDVDRPLNEADPKDYDALVLPGGVMSPDKLRMDENAVKFVKSFFEQGKPVAAICHGPWLLVEAGVVRGRKLTSYRSIRTDIVNAGGEWTDEAVVVDQGLVTSRHPGDMQAFTDKMLEEIEEGIHAGQTA
ncbi:MAG TPA: type 1 glutamine amidotransferase domain-containing protein [Longimicrobiales bacterium]|nr:type 1 glutamine amidotransferase domain-containing protein [Longimicrobiales bacterium]